MTTTIDAAIDQDQSPTVPESPGATPPPPPRHRLRRALRVLRTVVVVMILTAAAVTGGTYVVRQRLAERTMVDTGTAVLTAQPITVGSADAAVVTRLLATERMSVTAGAVLATITLTADGDGPRVQNLRAPAAGVVAEINVAPGQIARAGEPIVTLYDPAKLAFEVDVPLETLRKLRLGMTAQVTGPGLPGRIETTLEKVEPKVDKGQAAAAPDRLTVVLRPDPAALATVRTLVPGLRFAVVVDTTTAVGGTPAVNSA
ncbi:HlyD family efflux transporter periplasmic adaptor subunit [Jidongwangia harbinensis]|uniref:HlyD family efflux transporter periplasmic adaptor subunit n=1 Tax=Jidongwangia harbinensis TaxID=2878561 RepID=UPI001CD98271|nr:HlyD family secretion protein [Jidongwangia harbinensis]MCA2211282.1 HlyD family efflux transporter periplasmic adaptor subunit [Jidongwangia harbinensis]